MTDNEIAALVPPVPASPEEPTTERRHNRHDWKGAPTTADDGEWRCRCGACCDHYEPCGRHGECSADPVPASSVGPTDKPTTPEIAFHWVDGRYSTKYGYVGSLNTPICSLSWGTVRGAEKPWVLRVDVPGYRKTDRPCSDADEAQALTLRILARFMAHLSAPVGGGQHDNTE